MTTETWAWESIRWILFAKILLVLLCEVMMFQNAERIRWHTFLWTCRQKIESWLLHWRQKNLYNFVAATDRPM